MSTPAWKDHQDHSVARWSGRPVSPGGAKARRENEIRQGRGRADARLRRKAQALRARRGEHYRSPYVLQQTGASIAAARLQRGGRSRHSARLQHHRRYAGTSCEGRGPRALEHDPLHPRHARQLRSLPPGHRGQAGRDGQPAEGFAQSRRLMGDGGHVRPLHRLAAALRAAPDAVLHQFIQRLQAEHRRRSHPRRHRLQPIPLRRARSEDRQSLRRAGHRRDRRVGHAEAGRRLRARRSPVQGEMPELPRPPGVRHWWRTAASWRPALAGPNAWNMQSRNYFITSRRSCRASSAATCHWDRKTRSTTRNAATSRITSAICRGPPATSKGRWSLCSSRC